MSKFVLVTLKASRRALLRGLAAAAAVLAPALATVLSESPLGMTSLATPDPIFAAIKRERDAYAAYCVTKDLQRQISEDPILLW